MTPLPWRVGELARRTGLSVRALHHYDAIGLLEPSLRTEAGHRLYAGEDVSRLQQIQSLQNRGRVSLGQMDPMYPKPRVCRSSGRIKRTKTSFGKWPCLARDGLRL